MKWRLLILWLLGAVCARAAEPNPALADALRQACLDGNLNRVTVLVDQGAPVNMPSGPDGDTPILCCGKHNDVLKFLLAHGADPNGADNKGDTGLSSSAYWHYSDEAQVLLEAGANPNQRNKEGRTPLMFAALQGYDDMVKMLLDHHADVNANCDAGTPLLRAAQNNHVSTMKMLLAAGADVRLMPNPVVPDRDEWSLMGWVSADDKLEAMDLVLSHGLDINEAAPDGVTGLMEAVMEYQGRAVTELLKRGAKVEMADDRGKTTLMYAVDWYRRDIFEAILAAHPAINATDQEGLTPMMWAFRHNEAAPCWPLLLQAGANLDARDKQGATALIQTVQEGTMPSILFLLEHGADVNVTDKAGHTAADYAGDRGDLKLVGILKSHGAKRAEAHILPKEKPVPELSPARTWALAAGAIYCQIAGEDPFILGHHGSRTLSERRDTLKDWWDITDTKTCRDTLEWLRADGHRTRFQKEGAALAALDDNAFEVMTLVVPIPGAKASRDSYKKWKDRSGVAWDWVRYVNLVNLCYAAQYLTEAESWDLIMPGARELQKHFSSWQEMNDNFLDGRAIWNDDVRDADFDACSKLLLDPKEKNSPWNQSAWGTDLSER